MKIKGIFGAVLAILALMLSPHVASALSINTSTPTPTLDADGTVYSETGAELVRLTDVDGGNDDATAFLFLELAGFASSNELGIYDPTDPFNPMNQLLVFDGPDSPWTSATLKFDISAGSVENTTTGDTANIGPTFGFFINTPQNGGSTYYSETELNGDGFDHFLVYNTSDNSVGSLFGSDIVLAIEDLYGGGDRDYEDMVIGLSDVQPVPEPGTLALLGTGIAGIGLRYKRRKRAQIHAA